MKILIAEDDLVSRKLMFKLLSAYGQCDLTVDGIEAVEAFDMALDLGEPYDLICLDVMMPKVDGIKALRAIRDIERQRKVESSSKVKIIVLTALGNTEYVSAALETKNEMYVEKPIETSSLISAMEQLSLL
ncbi:two-component system chemotaxis response regulator CheY [Clostridium punense]|uniref:Stage 0 sporulation protein A homolog n=1 Tax=Clostridium punense TaxID=1054297 RepID=A0ABS4K0B3_9CLOT|nr:MULTISPECIES: response regulator [Clostridium]EQB86431.1 hypothetical protein M918_14285 [Clostridium sp. BL8]MBP2021233.1 two-component system chemotaxis response regulator CheY [Clostridium punense]